MAILGYVRAKTNKFCTLFGHGYQANSFQCPSETTSTVSSVTLIAV
jgi:hypothetical protein